MHGTLRFMGRHVYRLLLASPIFLSACGEYEYIRTAYPVNKASHSPQTPTSLLPEPPGINPVSISPVTPPPSQEWLTPGCFIDATALKNSPCTQRIIADVLKLRHSPAAELRDCFNSRLKMNIRFTIDSSLQVYGTPSRCILVRTDSAAGICEPDPFTVNIRIVLNPYHLSRSTRLSIAGSILHEMLHAYFFYRCADAAGDPFKEQLLATELPYLKPFRLNKPYVAGNHHEQMARNYIGKMAAALKEYEMISSESLQPLMQYSRRLEIDDYYKAVAWGGLGGSVNGDITRAWTDFKKANPKTAQAYEIIVSAEHNCTVLSASKCKCVH